MLSRFAKVSSFARKPSVLYRVVSTSVNNNNATPATVNTNAPSKEVRRYPHDAPERDFVNFPPVRLPEQPGKLRIGFIPDEWFQMMYDKTGVIGPYVIFWGGLATILSKEIFVYWADTAEQLVFLAALIGVTKMYGHKLAGMLDKKVDEATAAEYTKLNDASKEIDEKIAQNDSLQSLPEANKLIHAAKRENVHMQLEAAYRSRLFQVYQEIKKRLDYQVAIQGVYKRLERDEAINYIIREVNKSIGANQENEAFQSGLNTLRNLSKKYAGSI